MSEKTEAVSKVETKRNGEAQRYLAFSLCGEEYAIPLLKVKEVIALSEITPVPYTPPHFKGIMNLRGQVISVMDLRLKFRMAKPEITSETAIIILDLAPLSLGVIIDSVDSVLAVEPTEISPPPDLEVGVQKDHLTGVARKDKKLVLLLDIAKALSVEDIKILSNQQTAA